MPASRKMLMETQNGPQWLAKIAPTAARKLEPREPLSATQGTYLRCLVANELVNRCATAGVARNVVVGANIAKLLTPLQQRYK